MKHRNTRQQSQYYSVIGWEISLGRKQYYYRQVFIQRFKKCHRSACLLGFFSISLKQF